MQLRPSDEFVVDRLRASLTFPLARLGVRVMNGFLDGIESLERRDGDGRAGTLRGPGRAS